MKAIADFIIEIVIGVVFSYVGAFYRWLFFLGRKPYKHLNDQNTYFNGTLGITVTVFIILGVKHYISSGH